MEEEKVESSQTKSDESRSEETPVSGALPESAPTQESEMEEQASQAQPSEMDQAQAVPPVPAPEGRFRRGFRLVIRWTAGLLLVFALGFLAATLGLYLPKSRDVVRAEDLFRQANTRIEELEADIEALNLEIDAAAKNQEIQQEALDAANMHTLILSALADVTQARLALFEEDFEGAGLALTNTPETFQSIATLVDVDQADAVEAMDQRLALAVTVLEEDTPAALSDLEVIANNLVKLENTYFVVP